MRHPIGAGWREMTQLGFTMIFDEATTPTRPREEFARTAEDDRDSELTEKLWEQSGAKGRPL
jgi:hypothetical protein